MAQRTWTDARGRQWTVRASDGTLTFAAGGRTRTAGTERAGDLESLDDDELRRLFEAADEERDAAGDRPSSPTAAGRESAPHIDPARHGSSEGE